MQIFRRRANTIAWTSIVGVVVMAAAVVSGLATLQRSAYATRVGVTVAQPIPFSHRHHVNDDGIDCRYCHTEVERSAFAGIPSTDICMNCHRQIWTESPVLEPVRLSHRSGRALVWNRVHALPDFVFFKHGIHVQKGIGCSTCHGRVDLMPRVQKVESLSMSWCLDCHRAPERYVRPRAEIFNMEWQPPSDQQAVGLRLVREYGIQVKTSCSVCHH